MLVFPVEYDLTRILWLYVATFFPDSVSVKKCMIDAKTQPVMITVQILHGRKYNTLDADSHFHFIPQL